jgi:hypothetical protein
MQLPIAALLFMRYKVVRQHRQSLLTTDSNTHSVTNRY